MYIRCSLALLMPPPSWAVIPLMSLTPGFYLYFVWSCTVKLFMHWWKLCCDSIDASPQLTPWFNLCAGWLGDVILLPHLLHCASIAASPNPLKPLWTWRFPWDTTKSGTVIFCMLLSAHQQKECQWFDWCIRRRGAMTHCWNEYYDCISASLEGALVILMMHLPEEYHDVTMSLDMSLWFDKLVFAVIFLADYRTWSHDSGHVTGYGNVILLWRQLMRNDDSTEATPKLPPWFYRHMTFRCAVVLLMPHPKHHSGSVDASP